MLYVKPTDEENTVEILKPLSQGTDEQVVAVATDLFQQYQNDWEKLGLLTRFKENETYVAGNHWDLVKKEDENEPRPHTPVLWSTLDNIHSDLVEAYPRCIPEPETVRDKDAVRLVGDLQNASFARRDFKKVWRQVTHGLLVQGVDAIMTFWDKSLYGGLGDVNYQRWSIRNLRFDPFVSDINDSAGMFILTFERDQAVRGKYPHLYEQIKKGNNYSVQPTDLAGGNDTTLPENNSELLLVWNFFWREIVNKGTPEEPVFVYQLHWRKIIGGVVVEKPKDKTRSIYSHGRYPITLVPFDEISNGLFPLGLVDRFKKMQWFVDKIDQCTLKNLMAAIRAKVLVNEGSGIDIEALKDFEQDIVKGKMLREEDIRWFISPLFSNAPMVYANEKTAAIKDESGANQFNRGEGGRGVTAASAIYALQRAGSKRSRKRIDIIYDAICEVCWQAMELCAEFYTEARVVAITSDGQEPHDETVSREKFISAGKNGLLDMRMRMHAEQDSGYETQFRNMQAIELLNARAIDPVIAMEMMDFPQKAEVKELIRKREESELVQLRQVALEQQQRLEEYEKRLKEYEKRFGQNPNFRPPRIGQSGGEGPA